MLISGMFILFFSNLVASCLMYFFKTDTGLISVYQLPYQERFAALNQGFFDFLSSFICFATRAEYL